jgi:hypothetical protein
MRQSRKEGKTFRLFFGKRISTKILFRGLWQAQHKRFKRFPSCGRK